MSLEKLTNHVLLLQAVSQVLALEVLLLEAYQSLEVLDEAKAVIARMVLVLGLVISNIYHETHRRTRKPMKRIQRNSAQCRVSFCG